MTAYPTWAGLAKKLQSRFLRGGIISRGSRNTIPPLPAPKISPPPAYPLYPPAYPRAGLGGTGQKPMYLVRIGWKSTLVTKI